MDHAKYFKDQAAFWSNTTGARKHVQHYLAAASALDRVAALERKLAEARKPCPCKVREAADILDATTPRPWPPPPDGVTRCLGWDKERENWRVCIHEYGSWVFEDDSGFAKRWCPVWLPMPPEPEVGP